MKKYIFILVLSASCTILFAQSSTSDLYKQWMIEDINNRRFERAAQEITHVDDWYFDENDEKAFVDIDNALSFAVYVDSIGVPEPYIDSLFLYVRDECVSFCDYYYSNDNYEMALRFCELNAKINQNILGETHLDYAASLHNLGTLYTDIGDYTKAEQYYLEALKISKSLLGESHHDYAMSLNNLGVLYYSMGDYAKAEQYSLEALKIQKSVLGESHPDYAGSLNNLGVLYYSMGDYVKAEQYFLEALKIEKSVLGESHPDYAMSLNNLGILYGIIGDYAQAEQYFLKALKIVQSLLGENHSDYAASLNNLGHLYYNTGDYTKAEQYLLEALKIQKSVLGESHPNYAMSLNNLGALYEDVGYYVQAEQYLLEALKIKKSVLGENHSDYATSFNLGILYSYNGDYAKAEQYYFNAQKIRKSDFLQSLDYMSEQQRELYWSTIKSAYEYAYPTFAYIYKKEKPSISTFAYDNELFTKGLLLASSDKVRRSTLESGDTILIHRWKELTTKKQQITIFEEKDPQSPYLAELRTEAERLEKEVTHSSSVFRQNREQWQITWESVRNHLDKKQLAIEYLIAPLNKDSTMYCALLLRNNSEYPELIPLFEEKEVLSLINTSTENHTNYTYKYTIDEEGDTFGNGKRLSDFVWSNILPYIKPGETIYFAPSGLLHQLAIEAMPYDETHTMADMFNLVRLSSTREIVLRKDELKHSTATLYGGIQYNMSGDELLAESEQYATTNLLASRGIDNDTLNRGTVDYLKGTKIEVENINRMLKDNKLQVQLFTSKAANEESFKALSGKHQNILHIATHGFFWSNSTAHKKDYFSQRMMLMDNDRMTAPSAIDPLNRCGLLFAGANTALSGKSNELPDGVQDGILTAKEISLLDLRDADLVVLSACETGKGEITGEGVFGLQRAFKQAGAQTIIMSLWPVNDNATQLLMTEFYRNWITLHQSKREAFRNAQNTVRSQYSEPVYWAGFIMLD